MKSKFFAAIILIILLGTGLFFLKSVYRRPGNFLNLLEPEIHIHFPGSAKYKVIKNLLRTGQDQSFRSIEAVSEGKMLKVEITTGISPEDAQQVIAERLNMIRLLFSNLPSPYPGAITNRVAVPDDLKPKLFMLATAAGEIPLYILSSNSRYTYGAMSDDMTAYKGGLTFIYDSETKTLYRIDLFIPKNTFEEKDLKLFFQNIRLADSGKSVTETQTNYLPEVPAPPQETAQIHDKEDTLRRPGYNLILIAFEPLGADHVSSYGYRKKTTPNLDAFARQSFLFQNASSPSSWSLPVFMSWFTSLYPGEHKVTNKYSKYTEDEQILANLAALTPNAVTMTHVLKENGYHTAAFTGGASLAGSFGFNDAFDTYFDKKDFGGFDLTMPKAVQWLTNDKQGKFFLFVQGYDVHGKFPLEKKYLSMFLDKPYTGASKATENEYWALRNKNLEQGGLTLSKEDTDLWKAVYDAKIYAADKRFGEFIETLKKMNLLENSIIIVSSGSGNEYLQHGGIDHGYSLYEELLHVPLLIRIPGTSGVIIPELVSTIDLMPTVLDLLEIHPGDKVRKQMQGTSLVPLMAGTDMKLDAVAETDYLNRVFKRSIRTHDGWKFILSLDSEKRELYNLNKDPEEKNNLIGEDPRRAYELEQKMFKILKGGAKEN